MQMNASPKMRVEQILCVRILLVPTYVNVHWVLLLTLNHQIHWLQFVLVRKKIISKL